MSTKKQYSSPTYSSNQKTFPPVNMRERIVRLTETVNELRTNVESEAQNQDSLEKTSSKNYSIVNTQIKALRKAFNTLADVVMEELDSIRTEVFRDFQDSNATVYRKIDEISSHVLDIQSNKEDQQAHISTLEHDLKDRIRALEKKEEENSRFIQTLSDNFKEDQRALYDKLNSLIKNNSSNLDTLGQESEKAQRTIEDLQSKSNEDTRHINELYNKIAEIERDLKEQSEDLAHKITEAKGQTGNLKETVRGEIQSLVKGQGESVRRFEEITLKLNERADANEVAAQKRYGELEEFINQVQQEFQENVQELARIHQDSSTQIIVDFEKAVTSVSNENKVLHKRFAVLEGSVGKVREDFQGMVLDQERNVNRKNDQVNRALFDICRQLNISNPLLSH